MARLTETSPKMHFQFKGATQESALYAHQLAELHRMREMEKGNYNVDNACISADFGVFSSPVASGKTRTLLALIESTSDEVEPHQKQPQFAYEGIRVTFPTPQMPQRNRATLVICPPYLTKHWSEEATTCGIPHVVNPKKEGNEMPQSSLIILAGNRFGDFFKAFGDSYYRRIIIDEAYSIAIGKESELKTDYTWFISTTPMNLFELPKFKKRPLYAKHFKTMRLSWMRPSFVLLYSAADWVSQNKRQAGHVRDVDKQEHHYVPKENVISNLIAEEKHDAALVVMQCAYFKKEDALADNFVPQKIKDTLTANTAGKQDEDIHMCNVCYERFDDANASKVFCSSCCNVFCTKCMAKWYNLSQANTGFGSDVACPYCRGNQKAIVVGNVPLSTFPLGETRDDILMKVIRELGPDDHAVVCKAWDDDLFRTSLMFYRKNIPAKVMKGSGLDNMQHYKVLLASVSDKAIGLPLHWVTDIIYWDPYSEVLVNDIWERCGSGVKPVRIHKLTSQ